MKYIRKFNNLSEYQEFIEGKDYVEPHLVLIENDDIVKYKKNKPLNQIIGICIGKNDNTRLLGMYFDISQIDKMYIDNVEITPSISYSLTDNEHIVKYVMKNTFNNCYYMFGYCDDLTSLDLSSFDTSNVTNMNCMFSYYKSLTSLDLSSFDTSKVIDMDFMFNTCSSLTSLDLSSFDTSKVTNMGSMFMECSSLTSLDLSSFDISNVTFMDGMFGFCISLTNLNPFYNWKQEDIGLSMSPITPLAVHQLIERSMNASDGAIARTLTLNSTTKTNWQNSEYYNEDLTLLQVKNITIA